MTPLRTVPFVVFSTLTVAFAQDVPKLGVEPASKTAAQESPMFEAASVKPTKPDRRGSTFNFAPGQLQIGGGTLWQIYRDGL